MKKIKFLYGLAILLLIYCKNQNSQDGVVLKTTHQENICFTKSEREQVVNSILKSKYFEMYVHPELSGRLPIKLLKNDFITENLSIMWKDSKVLLSDSLILPRGNIIELTIDSVDCEQMKLSYQLYYPVEGAFIKGKTIKNDSTWISNVYNSLELDYESEE